MNTATTNDTTRALHMMTAEILGGLDEEMNGYHAANQLTPEHAGIMHGVASALQIALNQLDELRQGKALLPASPLFFAVRFTDGRSVMVSFGPQAILAAPLLAWGDATGFAWSDVATVNAISREQFMSANGVTIVSMFTK